MIYPEDVMRNRRRHKNENQRFYFNSTCDCISERRSKERNPNSVTGFEHVLTRYATCTDSEGETQGKIRIIYRKKILILWTRAISLETKKLNN